MDYIRAPVLDGKYSAATVKWAQELGGNYGMHPEPSVLSGQKEFLDRSLSASESLRMIEPLEKVTNDKALNLALDWIKQSTIVYILGYGVNNNNNARFGLLEALRLSPESLRVVMFTKCKDLNTINKRVARLLLNRDDAFIGRYVFDNFGPRSYAEKRIRDVYGALEMDFEPLEEIQFAR
jgi:hypothetical protein